MPPDDASSRDFYVFSDLYILPNPNMISDLNEFAFIRSLMCFWNDNGMPVCTPDIDIP